MHKLPATVKNIIAFGYMREKLPRYKYLFKRFLKIQRLTYGEPLYEKDGKNLNLGVVHKAWELSQAPLTIMKLDDVKYRVAIDIKYQNTYGYTRCYPELNIHIINDDDRSRAKCVRRYSWATLSKYFNPLTIYAFPLNDRRTDKILVEHGAAQTLHMFLRAVTFDEQIYTDIYNLPNTVGWCLTYATGNSSYRSNQIDFTKWRNPIC